MASIHGKQQDAVIIVKRIGNVKQKKLKHFVKNAEFHLSNFIQKQVFYQIFSFSTLFFANPKKEFCNLLQNCNIYFLQINIFHIFCDISFLSTTSCVLFSI